MKPSTAVTTKAIMVMAILAGCTKPPENVIVTNQYILSINRSGTGSGTITSSIPGIDCGETCSSVFAKNANVLLIATPSQGSRFSGWSGACAGNDCTVSMTADKTVFATFQTDGGNNGGNNNGGNGVSDTTKPTISISNPTQGQTVSSSNLTVTGTASDNNAVTSLEYSLNNAARVTLSTGTSFSFPVTLVAGLNTINVYAKDAAGNEGASSITVTYSQPGFTLTPEAVFFVGQKSVAFWKLKIAARQNFVTSGAAFDSVTLEGNAILGTGASKIQYSYRKADSTQDEIVLEIGAGSSVPVGEYVMTVRATSGSIVKDSAVTVRVAPCSFGCQ
jgi:Glucodextranase, domain B/Divergent InlB B-repeat domain